MKPFGADRKTVTHALRAGELTFAVYGLGKMGMPLAVSYAEAGGRVVGADVNPAVVEMVNAGRNPIEGEPELPELVPRLHAEGRLRATGDLVEAARAADVMVIIVPTLLKADRSPDLAIVEDVCRSIGRGLKKGDLVIQESTLPPGSTQRVLKPILEAESGLKAGVDFGIAFCPERTLSGRALRDIRGSYPKVVGGVDPLSTEAAAGIYEAINSKGVRAVADATMAEAVKVFEGLYRDVNIALANELALVCEELGIDARATFDAANHAQPYCHIHQPGCGVGGHCIPVYPYFITETVRAPTPLLRTARAVNDAMPRHTVSLLEAGLAGEELAGKTILVAGLTYRPGVKETRFSPALDIVRELRAKGARVLTWDPLAAAPPGAEAVTEADLPTLRGVAGVILTLDDPAYARIPWDALARNGPGRPVLVDSRAAVDAETPRKAGFTVLAVGRGGSG